MLSRLAPCALAAAVLAACTDPPPGDPGDPEPMSYHFGPYAIDAGAESFGDCISVTLHNTETIYVNKVDLETMSGFHHSNWFWVPENVFPGDDGKWRCSSRSYDEGIAGASGGVLFAQSTQSISEGQHFDPGVVIAIPPHSKIVAGIHLLNTGDTPLETSLTLTLTPIAPQKVTTVLSAMGFEYQALALPPMRRSSFTTECDIEGVSQQVIGKSIDFHLYYVLPHYHTMGRGLDVVATGGPNGDTTVFSTTRLVGEPLGENLTPHFDLTGYHGLRVTCTFDNPTQNTVYWGIGDQEMCVVQLFSDSTYLFGGGVRDGNIGTPVDDGTTVKFTHPCQMFAFPAPRP